MASTLSADDRHHTAYYLCKTLTDCSPAGLERHCQLILHFALKHPFKLTILRDEVQRQIAKEKARPQGAKNHYLTHLIQLSEKLDARIS